MKTIDELGLEISKIAFAGDWHGNLRYAKASLAYAKDLGADVLIHVGDFEFWPKIKVSDGVFYSEFVSELDKECSKLGLPILWVDGNHENFRALNEIPVHSDGTRKLTENIWHLPRGLRWNWSDVEFLAMGGAHSVDRAFRRENVDWFDEEHISIKDMFAAVQKPGLVDVMISHDCPSGVDLPLGSGDWIPDVDLEMAESHREILGKVVDETQPRYIFHGHYHLYNTTFRQKMNVRTAFVESLNCDGVPFEENISVQNIANFQNYQN